MARTTVRLSFVVDVKYYIAANRTNMHIDRRTTQHVTQLKTVNVIVLAIDEPLLSSVCSQGVMTAALIARHAVHAMAFF